MTEVKGRYRVSLPPYTEKALEQEVDQYLTLALPPDSLVMAFAKSGGRPKCPKCGTWVGGLAGGIPPGTPDRLIMVPGVRDVWIELKAGSNHQPTDDQFRCCNKLRRAGRASYVCRSVVKVAEVLRAEGIELRMQL